MPESYDVFDRTGERRLTVELRPLRSLIAVGERWVYVIFTGELDLQTLERYERPGVR